MNKKAFFLLELLVALSLSSFIIMGLLQSYRSLTCYLEKSRELIGFNRRICLLFNQMERDFMTAFIPTKEPKESKGDEKKSEKDKESGSKKSEKKEKKFDKKNYFLGEADDNQLFTKIMGNKLLPFKSVTFINSNPLQIFGQRKVRYVRVMYVLEKNKERSSGDKISYNLVRKESRDIKNVSMKVDEFDYEKQKESPISFHIVAEDVKGVYCQYVGLKQSKKDEKKDDASYDPSEGEEFKSFAWGDKKESRGIVPKRVEIYIDLWDEQRKFSNVFHAVFPILSFPTVDVKKKAQGQADQAAG